MKPKSILAVASPLALSLTLVGFDSSLHQARQRAFCRAAWLGRTNVMKILFLAGANVRECSAAYVDPLVAASESGNPTSTNFLLSHGADVNQVDEHGWTPLMYAAGAGQISSVRVLISRGADVKRTGESGSAANIASHAKHPEIVALLHDAVAH